LKTLIRLNPEQVETARRIADAAALDITRVAGPTSGATAMVADALQSERSKDFRHDILFGTPDCVLLLTVDQIGEDEWSAIDESTMPIVSLEPRAAGITDIASRSKRNRFVQSPLFRSLPTFATFTDIRESFGAVRSVSIVMRSRRTHGSLYARLVDAVDLMERLCGPAELIDASMSGPLGTPPETLRALHGHITVNARFSENCCACIHASDLGATWSRGITILGEGGCARLTDHALEWWNRDGELIDHSTSGSGRVPHAGTGDARSDGNEMAAPAPECEIAREINLMRDNHAPACPQPDPARLVALCECIRLSLRTGQGESPRKILNLMNL
jgi:hypothetical protein